MGLMSGYRGELFEKLAGTNAEVLVLPGPDADDAATRASLEKVPGVTSVARTAFAPGLLLGPKVPGGVDAVVKGLDVPAGLATTRLLGQDPSLAAKMARARPPGRPFPSSSAPASPRGSARRTGSALVLETASLSLARGVAPPRRTPLVVAGIVTTGFSEVDEGWAVVPIAAFDRFAPPDARSGVWELKLADPGRPDAAVAAAREALGPGATVLDWKTLNGDLFRALLVQQTLLFVVLALIVAVAAGTVVSSVVVLVAQKTREIGVLSAIGAGPADRRADVPPRGPAPSAAPGSSSGRSRGSRSAPSSRRRRPSASRPRSPASTTSPGCRSGPSRATSSPSPSPASSSSSPPPPSRPAARPALAPCRSPPLRVTLPARTAGSEDGRAGTAFAIVRPRAALIAIASRGRRISRRRKKT